MTEPTSGLRLTITGGTPDPARVAAVAAAIAGLAANQQIPAPTPAAAWGRAARLEGIGQKPFSSATDPRL